MSLHNVIVYLLPDFGEKKDFQYYLSSGVNFNIETIHKRWHR